MSPPHATPSPPPKKNPRRLPVDLASQLVLAIAEHKKDKFHPR